MTSQSSELVIKSILSLENSKLEQVDSIFFEASAVKSFSSEEKKAAFKKRWLDMYLERDPLKGGFVALEGEIVLGYVVFHLDTKKMLETVSDSSLDLFKQCIDNFPAHLHINCHASSRGKGVGSKLLKACFKKLKESGISGVHIVTDPDAPNVNFYYKNDFKFQQTKALKNTSLLFMGKKFPLAADWNLG